MRKSMQQFWCQVLVCTTTLMACGQNYTEKQKSESKTKLTYSEDELFDGIIFKDGKVAKEVPEFKNGYLLDSVFTKAEDQKTARESIKAIKSKLKESNPNLLHDFRLKIESGDNVLIAEEIAHVQTDIDKILDSQKSIANTTGNGTCIVLALHNVVVVTSVAAVAIAVWKYFAMPSRPGTTRANDVQYEMAINSIAEKFKNQDKEN